MAKTHKTAFKSTLNFPIISLAILETGDLKPQSVAIPGGVAPNPQTQL